MAVPAEGKRKLTVRGGPQHQTAAAMLRALAQHAWAHFTFPTLGTRR